MTTLSGQQEQAIARVRTWLKGGSSQIFRLFGYAGTGKTTLARLIAQEAGGKALFGAYTGKAASVMRLRGCDDACTIHSMIYRVEEDEDGNPLFYLKDPEDSILDKAKLVIIDECSMVDEALARDLLGFGVKILVLGDPAQLPPVQGGGFFTQGEPDAMLTEVHRQARDNPIIALSLKIRQGERPQIGTYGGSRIIRKRDISGEEVCAADQVIVGTNKTRQKYNARIRELSGFVSTHPEVGEKLVCLRNDRKKGLLNGSLWRTHRYRALQKGFCSLRISPADDTLTLAKPMRVRVHGNFFSGGEDQLDWKILSGSQQFTYGYALTCHKAQGSQWNDIVVFDESYCFGEDASRWLYTAVTRASDKLTLAL